MLFNFDYDKLHLKEITVLMPKSHQNINSFLTPILGLYSINIKDFINDFEKKTSFLSNNIIVPTRIRISKIKTFSISIKTPYVHSLISKISNVNLLQVYKISLVKSTELNKHSFRELLNTYYYIRLYVHTLNSDLKIPGRLIVYSKNIFKKKHYFCNPLNISNFGIFVNFNNDSSAYTRIIRTELNDYKISLTTYSSKLLFHSNNVLNIIKLFHSFLLRKPSYNLFINCVRINNNLLSTAMFKYFINIGTNKRKVEFHLFNSIIRLIRFIKINVLKQLNLIKKIHANLPSNIL